jgi:uncharacterized Fe-S cluster protein YjdI
MAGVIRRYTNGEITVVWEPGKCLHSQTCFYGLPTVFDPRKRPWVTMERASTEAIAAQVGRCPSGALTLAPAETPPGDGPPSDGPQEVAGSSNEE